MRQLGVSLLCFLLVLTGLSASAAAKRVALVIGNDSYENVPDLKKAVNDAQAVGAALELIGFEVLRGDNVSRREMNNQLQSFASKLEAGDEALFFFAGHGVGIEGRNFLLPVDAPDAKPGQEDFVEAEAVSAERVLDTIRRRGARVAILVLDACRDNPFQREGTRSVGGSRGLARMDASKGTFIIYSADVGQTALDRLSDTDSDPNSIFTRSLIPMLKRPGLSLPQMARDVRVEVEKLALGVRHDQRPAYYDGITGDFFFAKESEKAAATGEGVPAAAPVAPSPVASPGVGDAVEVAFWNSVQSTDSPEAIQQYLTRFPNGTFADLANLRLRALEQKQAALSPPDDRTPLDAETSEKAAPEDAASASMTECDRLAAHPDDAEKMGPGIVFEAIDAPEAIVACQEALKEHPQEGRLIFQLGRAFDRSKNYAEAVRWYRNATDLSYAAAMAALGNSFDEGTGVSKNKSEAVRWYRKGAELGNSNAMIYLAYMLNRGQGVSKNMAEHLHWLRKAAELGNTEGLYNLAAAYDAGDGVSKDPSEAAAYIYRSLKAGNETSRRQMTSNANAWSAGFRRELQRLMQGEGIYDGPIDGKFGPGAKRAIEALASKQ